VLAVKLDVTRPHDAEAAVETAAAKFGRVDILVNNAGNFFAGLFEELSPAQIRSQIETLLSRSRSTGTDGKNRWRRTMRIVVHAAWLSVARPVILLCSR
jgi:NAD(P)-dependent dehydrogenase (short-subunit alcohol dehydrogenase family)